MAKQKPETTPVEESPYVSEQPKAKKSLRDFASSRGARIGAIVAGSTLALGAAFGIGLTAGHAQGPDFRHSEFGQNQPADRDHGKGGKPGHFGDRDGKRDGMRDGDRGSKMQPPVAPDAPAPVAPVAP